MKTIILILSFFLSFNSVFSQATSGTRITAPVVPNDSSDVYPTHDAYFGRDGFRSVIDTTQRNNIPAGFRKEGMLIWCKSDSITYQLLGGTDNANWVQYSAGGSGTYHPYGGLSTLNIKADTLKLRGKIKVNDSTVLYLPNQNTFRGSMYIGNGGTKTVTDGIIQGWRNTAIGMFSMYNSTTASRNTAIGFKSLFSNTSGSLNIAVGDSALLVNTTGNNNTAIGQGSLVRNTTGQSNLALGSATMVGNTTGNFNTGLGQACLESNSTGTRNVVIGHVGMRYGTNNNYNTIIGDEAGRGNVGWQSTNYTIKIGYQSGYSDSVDYRLFIEPSNSQTPLIGGKFDEDKVGVNMLITSAWDSIFNVGGGIKARGGLFTNDIKAKKLFTTSITDTASSTDLQLMPRKWILERLGTGLNSGILQYQLSSKTFNPYPDYATATKGGLYYHSGAFGDGWAFKDTSLFVLWNDGGVGMEVSYYGFKYTSSAGNSFGTDTYLNETYLQSADELCRLGISNGGLYLMNNADVNLNAGNQELTLNINGLTYNAASSPRFSSDKAGNFFIDKSLSIGTTVAITTDSALVIGLYTTPKGIHVTGGVKINGTNTAAQYKLSALNTAPSSATDTGTTGEVRITADYIYICTSTNTWKRTAINTW